MDQRPKSAMRTRGGAGGAGDPPLTGRSQASSGGGSVASRSVSTGRSRPRSATPARPGAPTISKSGGGGQSSGLVHATIISLSLQW